MRSLLLAAILGQVVSGLAYLSGNGLEHGSLTCSSILVSRNDAVKIAGYERCYYRTSEGPGPLDIRVLKSIAAQLMSRRVNGKGAVHLAELSCWDPVAVNFLANAASAMSVHELQSASFPHGHGVLKVIVGKHPLLKLPWMPARLKSVVSKAIRMVRINLEVVSSPVLPKGSGAGW
ncbi:hypothetical protein GQ44DRAFT_296958 [Phaeosphaeriaceae sp. PMI808]|nr:hypothetical protein GQ44DRAFT_296958 [Phaeosphaeriaceae sp. PMI808]